MSKITPINYVRIIITDLKNTHYLLGLQHSIIGFLPESKELIDLNKLRQNPEDFLTGDDTAPIYSGYFQFRFNQQDAEEIRNYFNHSSEFAKAQILDEEKFLKNSLDIA